MNIVMAIINKEIYEKYTINEPIIIIECLKTKFKTNQAIKGREKPVWNQVLNIEIPNYDFNSSLIKI
jgi:hypothetical protein